MPRDWWLWVLLYVGTLAAVIAWLEVRIRRARHRFGRALEDLQRRRDGDRP